MSDDRLPTELWVTGHLHQLTLQGKTFYIAHKGAYSTGTVMLKISDMRGQCKLLQQQRDLDGEMGWMQLFKGGSVAEREEAVVVGAPGGEHPFALLSLRSVLRRRR